MSAAEQNENSMVNVEKLANANSEIDRLWKLINGFKSTFETEAIQEMQNKSKEQFEKIDGLQESLNITAQQKLASEKKCKAQETEISVLRATLKSQKKTIEEAKSKVHHCGECQKNLGDEIRWILPDKDIERKKIYERLEVMGVLDKIDEQKKPDAEQKCFQQEQEIVHLEGRVTKYKKYISEQKKTQKKMDKTIAEKNSIVEEKDVEIAKLTGQIKTLENKIKSAEQHEMSALGTLADRNTELQNVKLAHRMYASDVQTAQNNLQNVQLEKIQQMKGQFRGIQSAVDQLKRLFQNANGIQRTYHQVMCEMHAKEKAAMLFSTVARLGESLQVANTREPLPSLQLVDEVVRLQSTVASQKKLLEEAEKKEQSHINSSSRKEIEDLNKKIWDQSSRISWLDAENMQLLGLNGKFSAEVEELNEKLKKTTASIQAPTARNLVLDGTSKSPHVAARPIQPNNSQAQSTSAPRNAEPIGVRKRKSVSFQMNNGAEEDQNEEPQILQIVNNLTVGKMKKEINEMNKMVKTTPHNMSNQKRESSTKHLMYASSKKRERLE